MTGCGRLGEQLQTPFNILLHTQPLIEHSGNHELRIGLPGIGDGLVHLEGLGEIPLDALPLIVHGTEIEDGRCQTSLGRTGVPVEGDRIPSGF